MTVIVNQVRELLSPGRSGDPVDDIAETLGEMVLVSRGRPWELARPGLETPVVEVASDRVIVSGRSAGLAVQFTLTPGPHRLAIDTAWTNPTPGVDHELAVGLIFEAPADARVTMPQVIYHDNPSADRSRPVPHTGRGGFVTQLHRLPIPAVCAEHSGSALIISLDPDGLADRTADQDGSLGVVADPDRTMIIAACGVLLFDGKPDVDYVHKARTTDHERGYLELPPGESYRQRLVLDRTRTTPPGQGFRRLVDFAADTYLPTSGPSLPAAILSRGEAIAAKAAALDARWFESGEVAGYLKFPAWGEPRNKPGRPDRDFLYGWTGQCLRLAWCDARLADVRGEPWRLDRCRRVADFYLAGSQTATPGLRWNSYIHDDSATGDGRHWFGFTYDGAEMVSSRAYGETLCALTDIIEEFRRQGERVPDSWPTAVVAGTDFVARSRAGALLPADAGLPIGPVLPIGWRPDGTPVDPHERSGQPSDHARRTNLAGAPAAQAVIGAYRLTGEQRFLDAAQRLVVGYLRLPGPMFERPYALSTIDAACEDKESGLAMLRLLVALHDVTHQPQLLEHAAFVADWLLTWVYHWTPDFPDGSMLATAGFRARGWPGVSVQNHHLDVFFPTYDLWRLGVLLRNDRYRDWAIEIDVALRQGICTEPGAWGFDVVGEQTEAFFVTDWQQRGAANTWNPSWVIALPLWQALLLQADDVLDPVRDSRSAQIAVDQADVADRRLG